MGEGTCWCCTARLPYTFNPRFHQERINWCVGSVGLLYQQLILVSPVTCWASSLGVSGSGFAPFPPPPCSSGESHLPPHMPRQALILGIPLNAMFLLPQRLVGSWEKLPAPSHNPSPQPQILFLSLFTNSCLSCDGK